MHIMKAVYRAMMRAATAIDNSPELAPVARAAVAPLLATPLSRKEYSLRLAEVVRMRVRSELSSRSKKSARGVVDGRSFQIIKTMRAVLRKREHPTLYSAALGPSHSNDSSTQPVPSLLLVVGSIAVFVSPIGEATKLTDQYLPSTLDELCKKRHVDVISSTNRNERRSFRYIQGLPVLSGGDVPTLLPLLVHRNPLVAHMIQQAHGKSNHVDLDAACFVSELRDVLKLPARVVATLNEKNCCVFGSCASEALVNQVTSSSDPFPQSGDAIARSLFRAQR